MSIKKIGRNEMCPCGSGKKYKKCCLIKDRLISNLSESALDELKTEFSKYNQIELIKTIGGLQLCPENQSQLVRLEVAARIVCLSESKGTEKIDAGSLNKIINKYLPAEGPIGVNEDPSEGLFTDNIVFFGGSYTVYSGLARIEPFILRNIFQVLFKSFKNEFPRLFLDYVYVLSMSLLVISRELINRMDAHRYMSSPDRWRQDIYVPGSNKLQKLRKSVTFTKEEIKDLLEAHGLDYEYISPFIIPVEHESFNNEVLDENPLLITPMVILNDKIIVASPGSMMGALRHYILVKSQEFGAKKELVDSLRKSLWIDIKEHLRQMHFYKITKDLPAWKTDLSFEENVFSIDSDKLAYVMLITDKLEHYETNKPYATWGSLENVAAISERCKSVTRFLTKDKEYKILIIVIMGESGRYGSLGITEMPENSRILLMSTEELDIVARTKVCDNLTFWKFAGALDKTDLPATSFLDSYALYLDHHHSFYLSDDVNPNGVFVGPDMLPDLGKKLRIKVARLWDIHSVIYTDNPPMYAPVIRTEDSVPIYKFKDAVSDEFSSEHFVDGYFQSLWVGPVEILTKNRALKSISSEIAGTIAYWFWQFTPDLKSHLEPLNNQPIHIKFDLKSPNNWNQINNLETTTELLVSEFKYKIYRDSNTIEFEIPDKIIKIIKRADNKAEIILMDGVLKFLGMLLSSKGLPNTLNKSERERILKIHAPLGIKKKLMILHDEKPDLDPRYLHPLRKIQEHNVEEELEELINELGARAPPVGSILNKKKATKLCNYIVEFYYNKLKANLSKSNSTHLLKLLISNYESVINYRAINDIFTPPSIECYANISLKVEKEMNDVNEIDKTALSLRTLIEIVAAEQKGDKQELSLEQFDELLAITYNLISWSIISDYIHCKVFDIKLIILKSGRIGFEKNMEDILYPFKRLKTLENVESSIKRFNKEYERKNRFNSYKPENELEIAFKSEFGLTLTDLANFCGTLTSIGFKEKVIVPSMPMSKLKRLLQDELKWTDEKIETVLDTFSFKRREKWEIPPDGFDMNDIFPWRYNRRLSYAIRPLIVSSEPTNNPIVFWGSRNAYETGIQLLNLVLGGTYRIHEGSSDEMKFYLAKMHDMAGKEFTQRVKKWFNENSDFEILSERKIGPHEKLKSDKNLGDIDILAIDKKMKRIFSIECKNIKYGRNPREIAQEIRNLIGDKKDKDSWMNKHIKRDKWLKDNIKILESVFNLDSDKFEIYSLFLTSQEIPSIYIEKMPLDTIAFSYLKRRGVIVLQSIFN